MEKTPFPKRFSVLRYAINVLLFLANLSSDELIYDHEKNAGDESIAR